MKSIIGGFCVKRNEKNGIIIGTEDTPLLFISFSTKNEYK